MQKNWNILTPDNDLASILSMEAKIPAFLAKALINRGIDSPQGAEAFLSPDLSCLHKPRLLPDIEQAVSRIKKALKNKENILIFGDYDVDGLTSCALLKLTLERLGAQPLHYIPHRVKEGYGLNKEAAHYAKEHKVDLLISVDCGVTNVSEIELLNHFCIDTVVIDHHEPHDILPDCCAIVNPKLKESKYPFRDLAAVGVVYKLCQELCGDNLGDDLDLVSLGTIADVVPLVGENRILAHYGLSCLNKTKKPGLKELIKVAGLGKKEILSHHISFILGPRLNASGRIASGEASLNLLLSRSAVQAKVLAEQLHSDNRKRQGIEEKILDEALAKLENEINFKNHSIIVLNNDGWHQGVLGIIASRLAERFYRPAIIISTDEEKGRGSGRSIKDFHLLRALSQCSDLLDTFGGHSHAAGLVMPKHNIERFKLAINRIAQEELRAKELAPQLDIDAEVCLSELKPPDVSLLSGLAPFGRGNPEPVFASRNLFLRGRPSVLGRNTIKFWVSDGDLTYSVVGFGMGAFLDMVVNTPRLDLAYTPSIDSWAEGVGGDSQVQLELVDIKPSS